MKCVKCGTEFYEGIFCPECGTRLEVGEESISTPVTEPYDAEAIKLKNETLQMEAAKVEAETKRLEKEAEIKRLQIQEEQLKQAASQKALKEKASRTFRNVEYKTTEECNKAKKDHETIEQWISELSRYKKQNKRQELFASLPINSISTADALERIEKLKTRVNVPDPIGNKINFFIGILALVTFVLLLVVPDGTTLSLVMVAIGSIAFWVWLIWRIIIIIKSKSKSSPLYLKDI